MLKAKLRVLGGRHHGKTIPLTSKKFLIGREQDCQLRPNSELVSRHHCVIAVDDFSVRIRDLGSTNGTFINDDRVRGEIIINAGDRIRVGKLDFELVIGDGSPSNGSSGDSQLLPRPADMSTAETSPLNSSDTSYEIAAVAAAPEDTGSSIVSTDATPLPPSAPGIAAVPPAPTGDSTVVWTAPQAPAYGHDPYAPMGMPYPQAPYQPAFPYMGAPGYGYQAPFSYPQMPMAYPNMYPQAGGYGMPSHGQYAPPPPMTAVEPEPEEKATDIPEVRLPDPKTTGVKASAPPPPPQSAPAAPAEQQTADGGMDGMKKEEPKPPTPEVKPSQRAADILKNYTQRRPV